MNSVKNLLLSKHLTKCIFNLIFKQYHRIIRHTVATSDECECPPHYLPPSFTALLAQGSRHSVYEELFANKKVRGNVKGSMCGESGYDKCVCVCVC